MNTLRIILSERIAWNRERQFDFPEVHPRIRGRAPFREGRREIGAVVSWKAILLLSWKAVLFSTVILTAAGCRKDEGVLKPWETQLEAEDCGAVGGFYLLNEGNMGSNKCTLDRFEYESGIYSRNIYPSANPGVVRELGDVGNDIGIYGSKLYAVVNCSHLVEVMDATTARHVATVSIPNCRNIVFDGGFAYVTSYAGPVEMDPNSRRGYVARIDTLTMKVTDTCLVGYQPEEMAIHEGMLYVANSGGYRAPDYDNTVSVVDLESFREVRRIPVAINLHRMEKDGRGRLWVSSRGDNRTVSPQLLALDPESGKVLRHVDAAVGDMAFHDGKLFIAGEGTFDVYDVDRDILVKGGCISDGTGQTISRPYGIAVNPVNGDVLITDARDYVTPGTLRCYNSYGYLKWTVTTGDIPAHIVFFNR